MDAANKFCKNTGLLFSTALTLVLAAPGWAQTPSLAVGTPIALNQSVQNGSVSVASSIPSTPITFSASITSIDGNGVWLALNSPGTQTTPDTVFYRLNQTAGMLAGNYSATVTLTPSAPAGVAATSFVVTWANGSGGGGGGGGGLISVSPTTVALSASPGGSSFGNVTVSTSSTNPVSLQTPTVTTTTCGSSWLSASLSLTTITNSISSNLNIGASAVGFTGNITCNGTVTVTPAAGTPVAVNVTLTVGSGSGSGGSLTVSPGFLNLTYTSGGSFPSQNVTVTDNSSSVVNANSNSTWLLINNSSSTQLSPGVATVSLSSVAGGLATGSYSGIITFSDTVNNTAQLSVTLVVNGGSSAGLTVSPTALSFSSVVGGGSQSSTLAVTSTSGGNFSATPSTNWISTQVNTGTLASNTQGSVTVTVIPGGLSNGTYTGSVTVNVGGQAQSVQVTLVVGTGSGGSGSGTGAVSPNNVQLSWQANTDPGFVNRPDVVITGTSGTWSSSVNSQGSWLSLSPASGSSLPAQATVVVNPTGLTAGTYSGTITITTLSGTQTVNVTLAVSSGAVLTSRPGSVIFNYQSGTGVPAGQSVFFSTSDITLNQALDITGTVTSNAPWLSVTTFQKSIQVFADPRGLTAGVYSGSVTVSPATVGSLTVPVVLVIDNGIGSGSTGPLSFSPNSLNFTAATGANPPAQTLSISSTVTSSFTVTSNNSWLIVNPASGTTPSNLGITVVSSNLSAGSYSGILTFNTGGTIQNVPVTLTVTGGGGGGGGTGNVVVSPSSLTFTGQTGATTLPVQALQVNSASGVAGVGFTISVSTSSGGNWLTTSPSAGQQLLTSTSVSVTANASGLGAGTYNGNIQISPNGGTVQNVPVTLTITSPASVSASPATLSFSFRAGGAAPAAQTISVSGNGGSLAFTATPATTGGGSWLTVTPTSGTTPATITASVNPTGLSAGNYTGTITVAGNPGSTTINVSLSVTAPLPTITKVTNAASYVSGNISPGEIITLFGTDLGPATAAGLALDSTGKVATTVAGVQVTVNGFLAPLIYVSNTQISAVVPYELAQFTGANVLVKYLGQSSNGVATGVSTTVPGVFTANSSGTGPAAALNQNGSPNSPSNPATRGNTIVLYLTGEGQTSPAGVTGNVTTVSATPPLTPAPLLPISILIGGQPANYSFAGEAPGFVTGVMQLNVTVPLAAGTGPQSVTVSVGGNQSQSGVTVSLQ